ncbi:serine/threonine-protein kinase 36 [Diretmus argenteus]
MNPYHVLELVGQGSFGRVYKGRKRCTGQVVALKCIPKVGRSEKELRSLKKEIEIMRGLQHPNIVQMFDSFETETEVVVVTEYAEGELFQILEDDGSLPENQVREIACQLVSALYYLHSHRILHRDMKPQNILLGKCGVVKLCDFGFARAMSVSTLVLTSIKGTPLYMSPELVEEKPYDHTADLWSLGCILYELHTGAPPFYTCSMFQLMRLIVSDPVKWPDTMSQTCTSFLKGLLTKDPQKRLSWPDLLHHPFVADGVLVLSDVSVFNPLTVPPSPDILALKHQQVVEKTVPTSGESRLLRKAREQMDNNKRRKQVGGDAKSTYGMGYGRANSPAVRTSCRAKRPSNEISSGHLDQDMIQPTANLSLNTKDRTSVTTKHRGQISRDYEREFPSVEVGPRLVRSCSEDSWDTSCQEDVDSEEVWERLAQETDPRQQTKPSNPEAIIPLLKNQLLLFKTQLADGIQEGVCLIHQPLRVLRNLILTADLDSYRIGCEVGLPHTLFDLVHDAVENPAVFEQPWCVTVLGEVIVVLLTYWEKHCDWVQAEDRLEEFTMPFVKILNQSDPNPLAPLAASVLSMFMQHGVSVDVGMDNIIILLKHLLLDSYKPQLSPPPGWGLFDGLLLFLAHTLSEHENSPLSPSLDPGIVLDLWKRIGTSLEVTPPNNLICSANGLCAFLSTVLFVFIKDPHSCVPLFSESESKCVYTLGHLLHTDCLHLPSEGSPESLQEDLSHGSLPVLSCHLLCFPFALDLPSSTMSRILQLYDSCGIISGLLQVIRALPPPLLELPLSLLSRLLLCDPGRSVPRLRAAAGACSFFSPPSDTQLIASKDQTSASRTASSLLSALLQPDLLWESAVELLTLLSQVARCSPRPACLQLHLEPTVLHQALAHSHDRIRAATCSLLGNLDPFRPTTLPTLQPAIFKDMIDCLHDPCLPVRRMACRAVGNWLGCIVEAGFKMGRSNGKGSDITGWGKVEDKDKHECSHVGAGGALAPVLEQGLDHKQESRWIEEAQRTAAMLAALITDPDALTRRHSCAALGNLVNVYDGVSLLLEEDVSSLLLKAACTDPHHAVRQAAIATLCLYSQQDAIHQVLISLDAPKKLLQASHDAPPQCDYRQLVGLLCEARDPVLQDQGPGIPFCRTRDPVLQDQGSHSAGPGIPFCRTRDPVLQGQGSRSAGPGIPFCRTRDQGSRSAGPGIPLCSTRDPVLQDQGPGIPLCRTRDQGSRSAGPGTPFCRARDPALQGQGSRSAGPGIPLCRTRDPVLQDQGSRHTGGFISALGGNYTHPTR